VERPAREARWQVVAGVRAKIYAEDSKGKLVGDGAARPENLAAELIEPILNLLDAAEASHLPQASS
jgi:hypothetical protein